jgi:hypothetical protein
MYLIPFFLCKFPYIFYFSNSQFKTCKPISSYSNYIDLYTVPSTYFMPCDGTCNKIRVYEVTSNFFSAHIQADTEDIQILFATVKI